MLLKLPNEILLNIVGNSLPASPTLHDRDEIYGNPGSWPRPLNGRSDGTSDELHWFQYDSWPSMKRLATSESLVANLHALCLTCHKLKSLTTPALYRSVTIRKDRDRLLLLLRSLLENPELGVFVLRMSFADSLSQEWARDLVTRLYTHELPQASRDLLDSEGFLRIPQSGQVLHHLPSSDPSIVQLSLPTDSTKIMNVLMALTPKIATILVRLPLPHTTDNPGHITPITGLCRAVNVVNHDSSLARYNSVTTLQLKSDGVDLQVWGDGFLTISLASFPNLKTLDLCLDRSTFVFDSDNVLSRLETLRFVHTVAASEYIADLVERCPALQLLSISCVPSVGGLIRESNAFTSDIARALRQTPVLRSLHLQHTLRWRGDQYGSGASDKFEADVRLGSVAHLSKLESLTVETMCLWGSYRSFDEGLSSERLSGFLPKSLLRLELIEVWYQDRTQGSNDDALDLASTKERYQNLTTMVKDLVKDIHLLPKLQEVVFRGNVSDWIHPREAARWYFAFIEDSRLALLAVGIEFTASCRD